MLYRILILLILLLSAPAWGATITVCASGCDQTTIAAALGAASAGDTIEIRADTVGGSKTYSETNLQAVDENLTIQGRTSDTITIDGSGGNYCLMLSDGSGTPGSYTAANGTTVRNLQFTGTVVEFLLGTGWPYPGGANSVTVENCTFRDTTISAGNGWGIIHATLSQDFIFQNNTISNCTALWGVLIWKTDRFTISNNTITGGNFTNSVLGLTVSDSDDYVNQLVTDTGTISNNTFTNVNDSGTLKSDGHMIGLHGETYYSRRISRVTISGNIITSCGLKAGTAIAVYNSQVVTIKNNYLYDNDFFELIGIGTNCKTINVYNNILVNNRAIADFADSKNIAPITVMQATGGCETCTELDDVYIYNNTVADNNDSNSPTYRRGDILISVANAAYTLSDIVVKNNIFSKNCANCGDVGYALNTDFGGAATVSGIVLDNNIWWRTANTEKMFLYAGDAYTLAQFSTYQTAKSQDAHSVAADPLLNSAHGIAGNSPAKDAGAVLYTYAAHPGDYYGHKIYGTGPDIGAVEYEDHTLGGWFFEMFAPTIMKLCASTNAACYTQP